MRSNKIKRVVVGVSGGVDSAVSTLLLKNRGYELLGVFMKNWDTVDENGKCTYEQDAEDAHRTCTKLNIKFLETNFVKDYWNSVFYKFLQQYEEGLTPNPDVMCNQFIKFDTFLKYATQRLGADAIATGHYAKNSFGENLEFKDRKKGAFLLKAYDKIKDQTYFLSHIPQRALQKTIFPLGDYSKTSVKQIAQAAGLSNLCRKKESYGICFVGKKHFKSFIGEFIPPKPGNFVSIETGEVLGTHQGIHYFTIGERCRVNGLSVAHFVVDKNIETSEIFVAPGHDHPALYSLHFITKLPTWINSHPESLCKSQSYECYVKLCSTGKLHECLVHHGAQECKVSLKNPQRGICPGQIAVFYSGEVCLGGAMILRRKPAAQD